MGPQVRKLASSPFSLRMRLAFSAIPDREKEREREKESERGGGRRGRNLPVLACVPGPCRGATLDLQHRQHPRWLTQDQAAHTN